MRMLLMLPICLTAAGPALAQPADCAPDPNAPPPTVLPMQLNLGGLPGVPRGVDGQIYVGAPMSNGGMTCTDRPPPPRDILRGEPGDVLHGARGDLLRGP
jgi:hypothetical protein